MEVEQLNHRISRLQDPWWSREEIEEFYGISSNAENSHLFRFARDWAKVHRHLFERERDGKFNRHTLERIFASLNAVPRKWMALQLGMKDQSLVQLLGKLREIQLTPLKFSDELIAESLKDDLLGLFDEFRFRTLRDHNDWCKRLHDAIFKRFKFKVKKAECIVSKTMKEPSVRYASTFDAISGDPLSTKYSVWVNFGKPISLPPDRCSLLLYWQHHDILHPFLLGTREPEQIEAVTA